MPSLVIFLIFVFGAADRIYVLFGLSYDTQLYIFRIAIWVIPVILFFLARRVCRELREGERIEEIHEQAAHEGTDREHPPVLVPPSPATGGRHPTG